MAGTLIPNCTQRVPAKPLRRRPDSTTSRRSPIPITARFGRSNTKNGLIELPNPRFRSHFGGIRAAATHPHSSPEGTEEAKENEESMSIDLRRFFELNLGKWNGSFYQFDANGNLLQNVSSKLSASSYGEDELISLIQTIFMQRLEELINTIYLNERRTYDPNHGSDCVGRNHVALHARGYMAYIEQRRGCINIQWRFNGQKLLNLTSRSTQKYLWRWIRIEMEKSLVNRLATCS